MTSAPTEVPSRDPSLLDPSAAAELGLHRVGARLGLRAYLRAVAGRRYFVWELSKARVIAANSANRLGRLWELLNPIMLVGVYYIAFGLILGAHRDSSNFLLFLSVGVFTWTLFSGTVTGCADSLVKQRALMRSVHFPRAILPLAVLGRQVIAFGPKLLVLALVAVATGEGVHLGWATTVPAMALAALFAGGLGMMVARVVHGSRDIGSVVPFVMRTWMYLSGVFYSVDKRFRHAPEAVRAVAEYNPGHVYISLMRGAFMPGKYPIEPWLWVAGVGWAVGFAVVGFVVFWSAEETYGGE